MTKKKLVILSDIHWGHPMCVKDLVRKNIRKCKRNSIDEVWLGGDLIEYVNKNAVGHQDISIPRQINEMIELLKPIKHKITKIIYGNHEERAMRNHDIEPTRLIAAELGLSDKYVGSNVDTGIIWGFKYYIEHPLKGRGNTKGYFDRFNKKLRLNHDAEVFIIPHFHTDYYDEHNKLENDKKTRSKYYFIYGMGYVDYWGTYGHTIHADISDNGSRIITFNLEKHIVEVCEL